MFKWFQIYHLYISICFGTESDETFINQEINRLNVRFTCKHSPLKNCEYISQKQNNKQTASNTLNKDEILK